MSTIGVIDIGTNSMREAVVRIDPNHDWHVLALQREPIRLGQGEFTRGRITRPAMERGLLVLKQFVDIARRQDVSDIVVVATSALREAVNRGEFVTRAKEESGVDVRVVSGVEEARLIYLGVASGIDMNSDRALFIDIGGGSTEIIVGDSKDTFLLDSLKLGAIRLGDKFLSDSTGPISQKQYGRMLEYVQGVATSTVRKTRESGFNRVYGSSGTIMNLAEVSARRTEGNITSMRNYFLKYDALAETIGILCSANLEQRRNIPGINPDRVDIIVSGAAILDALLTGVKAGGITITDRALREGLIIDHLFQEQRVKEKYLNSSVRERSILKLGRACRFEEGHAQKVSDLARSIFGQLGSLGLHKYGRAEEELLWCAALAHDIGAFVSYSDHHRHSYYMVRHSNLLGFDDEETETIATTVLCHRKLDPTRVRPRKLNEASLKLVQILASILRIADALDRSQMGLVEDVVCRYKPGDTGMLMDVYSSEDCPLEMWAFEIKKRLFEKTFGLDLRVRRVPSQVGQSALRNA